MIIFLTTISFLLHTISLLALILLVQRQNTMKQTEKKLKQTAAETEEMMMAFLKELKEENERFLKQAAKPASVKPGKQADPNKGEFILPPIVPRTTAAKAYTDVKASKQKTNPSRPLVEQMLDMQQKGLSEEEIARKLQIGITEVKLALKFNRFN